MTERKIDRIRILYLEGKVYARCYTGNVFTDAEMSSGCLANMVGDGGRVLEAIHQDVMKKVSG